MRSKPPSRVLPPPRYLGLVRAFKVFLAGFTTCGLAWFWVAFYLYDARFRRRRAAVIRDRGDR